MKDSDNKPADKPAGKPTPSKVFDVRRPGKAMASPTSRPILVGNKPQAEESQAAVSGIGETRPQLLNKRKIEILPSGQEPKTETEKAAAKAAASKVKILAEAENKPADKQADETLEVETPDSPPADAEKTETKQPEAAAVLPIEEVEAIAATALAGTTEPPAAAEEPPKAEAAAEPSKEPGSPAAEPVPEQEASADKPAGDVPSDLPSGAKSELAPDTEEASPKEEAVAPTESAPSIAALTEQKPGAVAAKGAAGQAEPEVEEPKIEPLFNESGDIIVSHHNYRKHSAWKAILLIVLVLILAGIVGNLLLDLGIVTVDGVPHTDFFAN